MHDRRPDKSILFSILICVSLCARGEEPKQIFLDGGQQGDEEIIDTIFAGIDEGYYVDIGAFDPIVLSNSFNLHSRGWSGVNVEASSSRLRLFNYQRSQDINLNVAIGPEADVIITLYGAEETASISLQMKNQLYPTFTDEEKVRSMHLGQICDRYFLQKPLIMNFDIEGIADSALIKNNWSNPKCIPNVIIAQKNPLAQSINQKTAEQILISNGYKLVSQIGNYLNEYYIHESVYDQYLRRIEVNKQINKMKKQYYDYRKFSDDVLNLITKQKNNLNRHSSPFQQSIYLHAARVNEILDIQSVNKVANQLGIIKNRPIVVLNFDPRSSVVLVHTRKFTATDIAIHNISFLVIRIQIINKQILQVYILDHRYKPLIKPKILSKQDLFELKTEGFSFKSLTKQIQFISIFENASILLLVLIFIASSYLLKRTKKKLIEIQETYINKQISNQQGHVGESLEND